MLKTKLKKEQKKPEQKRFLKINFSYLLIDWISR